MKYILEYNQYNKDENLKKYRQIDEQGYIKTGIIRIDDDYEPDDVEYKQEKVYVPNYVNEWHYYDNTDPDISIFDNLESALKDLEICGSYTDVKDGYSPVKVTRIFFKEGWIDKNGEIYDLEDELLDVYQIIDFPSDIKISDDIIASKSFDPPNVEVDNLHDMVRDRFRTGEGLLDTYEIDGYELKIDWSDCASGKYCRINIYDLEDEKVGHIQMRISNHSYNPRNNDESALKGDFISLVITNKDETAHRFLGRYNLCFDGYDDIQDVIDALNERVSDILFFWDMC